jgi:nitrogen fixation NifU-like protein
MTDLQELYQSVILDHNRKPRNFGALPEANREADGKNPLCGDEVHVALVLQDDTITDVRFTGHG